MPAFRQVGEKQLPNPVLFMVWSPKRDLIALANQAGEVRSPPSSIRLSRTGHAEAANYRYIYVMFDKHWYTML